MVVAHTVRRYGGDVRGAHYAIAAGYVGGLMWAHAVRRYD